MFNNIIYYVLQLSTFDIFRSPNGYRFLRTQNILPLPCVNTIRKYLLAIKNECGFDMNFFKLLKKKKCQIKINIIKKGFCFWMWFFLRTSISVNSRSLTYTGLEDFGEELPNKGKEKADHGFKACFLLNNK